MKILLILLMSITTLVGCNTSTTSSNSTSTTIEDKLSVIATTTMLYDLVSIIGNDALYCESLLNAGIDPHSYNATAQDIIKLNSADIVLYNGFHLEGEMGDIFSSLQNQGKNVICLENGIDDSLLLTNIDSIDNSIDPHIWFDVKMWELVATYVANELVTLDPNNSEIYLNNLAEYQTQLNELHIYIIDRIAELDKNQRVLITAHDAFNYFGNAYDFEVLGLQGINTQTEASTLDIINLATFIAENQIKAIFVESSVSSKSIEALQESVISKGFNVEIGGELYSDSLGDINSGHNTYIKTVMANIDTIVDALK